MDSEGIKGLLTSNEVSGAVERGAPSDCVFVPASRATRSRTGIDAFVRGPRMGARKRRVIVD